MYAVNWQPDNQISLPRPSPGYPRKVPILRLKKKGDDINIVFEKQVSVLFVESPQSGLWYVCRMLVRMTPIAGCVMMVEMYCAVIDVLESSMSSALVTWQLFSGLLS